jgi:hypothetical protein
MKTNRKPVHAMLDHAQKTFVRSRPGSVLILVIALLVLMALIGTAYMSMAQTDRTTSIQHENNTEIDMLMDGLANLLKGSVVNELYTQGSYRPGAGYNNFLTPTVAANYQNYTGLGLDLSTLTFLNLTNPNTGSTYLAARVPELANEIATGATAITAANPVSWSFITAPLVGGQFSSPLPARGAQFLTNESLYNYTQRSNIRTATGSSYLVPGAYLPGSSIPAWVDPNNPNNAIVAADADGDGIADSGFIKLPMGSINGVTYYAAFRIIDGNSAINVNTAWQHNPQRSIADSLTGPAAGAGSMPGDFFPTSIDLSALATSFDKFIPAVVQRHFFLGSTTPPTPTQAVAAVDANGNTRTDFAASSFGTAMEAEWMQFGRRIKNPGSTGAALFQAYTRTDLNGLVHTFVVRDPTLGKSLLETDLPNSLYSTVIQVSRRIGMVETSRSWQTNLGSQRSAARRTQTRCRFARY